MLMLRGTNARGVVGKEDWMWLQCDAMMIHLPLFILDSLFHHTCHPSIHHASCCSTTSLWFALNVSIPLSQSLPPSVTLSLPIEPSVSFLTNPPPFTCSSLQELCVSSGAKACRFLTPALIRKMFFIRQLARRINLRIYTEEENSNAQFNTITDFLCNTCFPN